MIQLTEVGPSNAYMRQKTNQQCFGLVVANPLSEPMLEYC